MTKKKRRRRQQTAQAEPAAELEVKEAAQPAPVAAPPRARGRVCVGDVVLRKPITISPKAEQDGARVLRGTVVWVHPKGYFHVVEFGEGARAVRESFAGVER